MLADRYEKFESTSWRDNLPLCLKQKNSNPHNLNALLLGNLLLLECPREGSFLVNSNKLGFCSIFRCRFKPMTVLYLAKEKLKIFFKRTNVIGHLNDDVRWRYVTTTIPYCFASIPCMLIESTGKAFW